jgi:hypothetical protein
VNIYFNSNHFTFFPLLLCCVWVHCGIYKCSYNVSAVLYLNSPSPLLSFIPPSPSSGNNLNRYHFCIYMHVYTFPPSHWCHPPWRTCSVLLFSQFLITLEWFCASKNTRNSYVCTPNTQFWIKNLTFSYCRLCRTVWTKSTPTSSRPSRPMIEYSSHSLSRSPLSLAHAALVQITQCNL